MTWTVEESKEDSTETALRVYKDEVLKGFVDVTLYANGPCIKCLTVNPQEDGPALTQVVVDYLQENYGFPDGVFAYVYDYADYERSWFEKAGLKLFNTLDEGARLLFKLDPPLVN